MTKAEVDSDIWLNIANDVVATFNVINLDVF
jgi:hypothetical protein